MNGNAMYGSPRIKLSGLAVGLGLLGSMALGPERPARAQAPIDVNTVADAPDALPGDGRCEATPGGGDCTLRAAVMEANAQPGEDRIAVADGLYGIALGDGVAGAGAEAGDLDVTGDLTVIGGGAERVTIDADRVDRVFDVAAGASLVLEGLTLTRGLPAPDAAPAAAAVKGGGCIRAAGPLVLRAMTVRDCVAEGGLGGAVLAADTLDVVSGVFTGHRSSRGGAIHTGRSAWIDRSTFERNSAVHGGALFVEGLAVIDRSRWAHNEATAGGAVSGGRLVVRRSWFVENEATGGGALATRQALIESTTFQANHATTGGAIEADNQAAMAEQGVEIVNSTFSDNWATGADAIAASGRLTVRFSTLAAAAGRPSGRELIEVGRTGTVRLAASLIAGPCSLASGGVLVSDGRNFGPETCGMKAAQGDILGIPDLGPIGEHGGFAPTLPLPIDSPGLNAAGMDDCPPTDQRGHRRPQGPGCDVGAYEVGAQPADLPTETPWPTPTAAAPTATATPGTPTATWAPTPSPAATASRPDGMPVQRIGQIGGIARVVAVVGRHVLVGNGPAVVVVDLDAPGGPRSVATVPLSDVVADIAVEGARAVVGTKDGLHVLDVTDPAKPAVVASLPANPPAEVVRSYPEATSEVYDVAIRGGVAYAVALGRSGWASSDYTLYVHAAAVADPTAARWVAVMARPFRSRGGPIDYIGAELDGATLFLGSRGRTPQPTGDAETMSLAAIDVSDPARMTERGVVSIPGRGADFAVRDGVALVAVGVEPGGSASTETIVMVDVRDPAKVATVGRWQVAARITQLFASGSMVFVRTVVPFPGQSVSPPERLHQLRRTRTELIEVATAPRRRPVSAVAAVGDRLVVLSPDTRLDVLTLADGAGSLATLSGWHGLGPIAGLDVEAGRVYATAAECAASGTQAGDDNIYTVDVPDAASPALTAVWDPTGDASSGDVWCNVLTAGTARIEVAAGRAYLFRGPAPSGGSGSTLDIVDVANPSGARNLGRYISLDGDGAADIVGDVWLGGGIAHIGTRGGGLSAVDVGDPTRPVAVGRLSGTSIGFAPVVAGSGNIVAVLSHELRTVDMSDPRRPRELFRDRLDSAYTGACIGATCAAAMLGDRLYLTAHKGVGIIDLADPARPRYRGRIELGDHVTHLVTAGRFVVVASAHSSGLWVLDMANPDQPRDVAHAVAVGTITGLRVAGDRIYVAESDGGLAIYRYAPMALAFRAHLPWASQELGR